MLKDKRRFSLLKFFFGNTFPDHVAPDFFFFGKGIYNPAIKIEICPGGLLQDKVLSIVRSLTPDQYATTGIDHSVTDVDQDILKARHTFQLQRKIVSELSVIGCVKFADRPFYDLVPAMRDPGFARHLLLPESIFEREAKKLAIDAQLAQRAIGRLFEQNDIDFHTVS